MRDWKAVGLNIPEILIPHEKVDLSKWAVIACDQYSSQPEYWQKVASEVGNNPSTLHQIIPEVYLEQDDIDQRITQAQQLMANYLEQGILQKLPQGAMLIRRQIGNNIRTGLLVSVDLEQYDYSIDAKPLIRPTEGTIIDRIPPRLKLRKNADVEYPHIMVLIDDPKYSVIEPLSNQIDELQAIYNFDLNWQGGHIEGYFIAENQLDFVYQALIDQKNQSIEKYGTAFLMAVGDGNHSLATAKAQWKNIKNTISVEQQQNHPARFALVELVNIHNEGIEFEPIHRVLFHLPEGAKNRIDELLKKHSHSHSLKLGCIQNALDEYCAQESAVKMDYIHGIQAAEQLGNAPHCMLLKQESLAKQALFLSVSKEGVLPRKSFSMGDANEKRYYLEGRCIK